MANHERGIVKHDDKASSVEMKQCEVWQKLE